MADDIIVRDDQGDLAVNVVVSTEANVPYNYDDCFTLDTNNRRALRVVGAGGGSGGAVSSVNGKTGAVVLDAEDVGALPEDTPIPDPQVQSDWDQTDPMAVDYIKNKPVIPTSSGVPQYETMPTASASNVGEIAQYSGETIPDVPASAVATQTVGSGLTDLSVNVETFIGVEQPTQSGNTSFVASVIEDNLDLVGQDGWVITVDSSAIINRIKQDYPAFDFNDFVNGWINYQESTGDAIMGFRDSNTSYQISLAGITFSIVVRGSGLAEDYVNVATVVSITVGSTTWSKNGTTVDLEEYGVSYSGTPVDGDTISVAYTPFVAGITNGYFYKSSAEYSDPSATISQTVGSGLTDLSVDVDTFVEAEQPTQSGNTVFECVVSAETLSPTSFSVGGATFIFDADIFLSSIRVNMSDVNIDQVAIFKLEITSQNDVTIFAYNNNEDVLGNIGVNITGLETFYGLTIDGVFVFDSQTDLLMQHTAASVSWTLNSETVDLAEYGISYSGTPANGDTLTVAYTAPTPIGYSWKQTDVQPSSGGGSAGIEWQEPIIMTKPEGNNDYLAPYVHLGSESGSYSFYVKVLRLVGGYGGQVGNSALGYLVYKISFDYDSTNADLNTAISRGGIGLVFDGDMQSQFPNENPVKYSSGVRLKKAQDGTLWVSVQTGLESDAFLYMNDGTTEKIAQFSKVYKDGEIINAECFVDKGYFWDTISYLNETRFTRSPLVDIPQYNYRVYQSFIPSDMNNNTQMMIGNGYGATEIYVSAESGEDRFIGKLYRKDDVNWEQEILIASGNFASWEFRHNGSDAIIYFGENAPTFTDSVYFNVGAFGVGNITMIQLYFDTSSGTSVPMVRDGKSYRLLTPVYSMLGGIHQYVGPTNANYTNGYYYKANGTVVVVPESITTNVTSPAGEATVTIDIDNFVNALNQWFGWSSSQIRNYLVQYKDNDWGLGYDVGNDKVTRLYLPWYGDIYPPEVLQYVSVAYTGSETGEVPVGFRVTYTPESKEVQNPSWDRVDVQPLDLTGVAGYDATKTQVLKNIQGTLTWVDE